MLTFPAVAAARARSSHTVRACDIDGVVSHRRIDGNEEYLVVWKAGSAGPSSPPAVASWHPLPELWHALRHVQVYVEELPRRGEAADAVAGALVSRSRKRKSPESDPIGSRDASLGCSGLLTPQDSLLRSPSPSIVIDLERTETPEPVDAPRPRLYNGVLQRKEGRIVAKRLQGPEVDVINTTDLPTETMKEAAARTPTSQAERAIRAAFLENLKAVKGVTLQNDVDSTTPSLNFTFIKEYVLREGVIGVPPEEYAGCTKCRPDMGGGVGCEYTAKCDCLQFASVDESALQRTNPEAYEAYMTAKQFGDGLDTTGLPKRFPYSKPRLNAPQTMVSFYREERYPIYECNQNCRCGPVCKSRLVQKGRRVPLIIFKTANGRGWGVKCDEDLIQGEFIDTYLGEVITNEECDRRESESAKGKESYLYSLDKFVGDLTLEGLPLEKEDCFVVDGQYMGNVTRFINHSCEPNCRQYTVSYNKHDLRLFNLAFFAYENIPRGTELTFDYADHDEVELEEAIRRREELEANHADTEDAVRCNCGTPKCRGFLWT